MSCRGARLRGAARAIVSAASLPATHRAPRTRSGGGEGGAAAFVRVRVRVLGLLPLEQPCNPM